MLSNNADQFMTTPMLTSITTQAQKARQMEMPAPRPTASFIPGMGDASFIPGMGNYVSAPAYAGTGFMTLGSPQNLLLLAGVAVGGFLLLRGGKGGRATGAGRRKGRGRVQYK